MTAEADKFDIKLSAEELYLAVGAIRKQPHEVVDTLLVNIMGQFMHQKAERDAAEEAARRAAIGDQINSDQD